MKISELIAHLNNARKLYGDVSVSVSVDISTGEDDAHARCFGDISAWNPGASEIVLLADNGVLDNT